MKTQETRALIKTFNDAWVRNDAIKMAPLVADDACLSYPPYENVRQGRDEIVDYITAQPGSTADDDLKVDTMVRNIHTLVVDGAIAVGFHHMSAEMKKGGTYSNEYVWRMICEDGKVTRLYGMLDRLYAIQQIGDKPMFHGQSKD